MPLDIKYNLKLERLRIKNTLEKLDWYDKLGYSPRFPKNIDPRKDDLNKIYKTLKDEYSERDYEKIANTILKNFSKIENKFFFNLKKLCGKKLKKNYILILTKYGVGGSYSLPNKIILNINSKSAVNTILHEITHIAIEPYIQKFKIGQNEKERIVDLILTSKGISLKQYKKQKRGEEVKEKIDLVFKEYFKPPVSNFFKKIC